MQIMLVMFVKKKLVRSGSDKLFPFKRESPPKIRKRAWRDQEH
jgi:hypothetical protein